jgi:hypothetical protein
MNSLERLLIRSGKVALGYLVQVCLLGVLIIFPAFGMGAFILWSGSIICWTIYICCRSIYRGWPNHRIFKISSLWVLGLITAVAMFVTGLIYGLTRAGG